MKAARLALSNEPVLITSVVSAALSLLVALGIGGLTDDQASAIIALITGLFGVVAALAVRPVSPIAFTTLVTVTVDLLAAFHFDVAPAVTASVNALVIAVLNLLARGHVTPVTRTAVDLAA